MHDPRILALAQSTIAGDADARLILADLLADLGRTAEEDICRSGSLVAMIGDTLIDLSAVLTAHAAWLGYEPVCNRADLGGADLGGADLGGADLGGADLAGAIEVYSK